MTTAMQVTQEEFDRLILSDHRRKICEAHYAKNPLDAQLEEALEIEPTKHEAMWSLGNAHTSLAFMIPDLDEAMPGFEKAYEYFQRAVAMEPGNESYLQGLEVTTKAPRLHSEIYSRGKAQQALSGGPSYLFLKWKEVQGQEKQ